MNAQSFSCTYAEDIPNMSQLLEVQIKACCDISLGKRGQTDVKYLLYTIESVIYGFIEV